MYDSFIALQYMWYIELEQTLIVHNIVSCQRLFEFNVEFNVEFTNREQPGHG